MDFDNVYKEIVNVSGSSYHAMTKERNKYIWERVSALISPESTVAEIGVGAMSALVRNFKGSKVIGVDLTDEQSALCDAFNIELRRCDIQTEPLPLDDESVDVILLLAVIEHLCIYPNDVFDKIYKKLKPGGYLVVHTVNFLRFSSRARVLLGRNPLINYFERTEDGRNHIREFVPDEMAYYLRKSGFGIERIYRFGQAPKLPVVSVLWRLAYLYPGFRSCFMIIGRK
jgi:SAM-dependent methyltransferase